MIIRMSTLLQPCPSPALIDVPDRVNRNLEVSGYDSLADLCRALTTNSTHIVIGQQVPAVSGSSRRCSVAATVFPVVPALSSPVEVRQAIVLSSAGSVAGVVTRRARISESDEDELVNFTDFHRAVLAQADNQIAADPWHGFQNPGTVPRSFRQAPHPAEVRHFVQAFETGNRQPAFGRIGHSRTSFAVRPGHCSSQRGRAVHTLAGDHD